MGAALGIGLDEEPLLAAHALIKVAIVQGVLVLSRTHQLLVLVFRRLWTGHQNLDIARLDQTELVGDVGGDRVVGELFSVGAS